MCDNAQRNSHYSRIWTHRRSHPSGRLKQRCTRGTLAASAERRGVRWHVCVGGRESVLTARCKTQRELMQGGLCWEKLKKKKKLACIPNTHADCSISVLYMVKYIYTFLCLMLLYAKEKSLHVSLWRSMWCHTSFVCTKGVLDCAVYQQSDSSHVPG